MSLEDTAEKIRTMEIRGAALIARAAVEALCKYGEGLGELALPEFKEELERAAGVLLATRPTAVSLPNAVNIVMKDVRNADTIAEAREALRLSSIEFIRDSKEALSKIAEIGARHIPENAVLMTHCNSQAAIGCIIEAHRQGKIREVYATEVRPRNQGLLTIRALNDAGIKTNFIVDSAARFYMKKVDLFITGTDAVTVNGAVVNKIGTSQIALAAREARVPMMVAAETFKFAPKTIAGDLIKIEERDSSEVLAKKIAGDLDNVTIKNPAFDVTPADFVDLIITEKGAIPPEMAYIIIRDYLGWEIGDFR
ncbi:translation initiation factor, aIF-2BII family [Methanolacinia petrolearia DSM 11571]|uniref:Ribose 1,5-bisphosphate isomerase n=1 Tax=Methanolacinia petrolearia (strain DSM 11571 / OCM 486 / SEBR 4847) TaxID=679926 RepID=E1RH57_METP4|nr:ribose 1,5-bisphosphate isomerase [Methanolacinia petrolearia]ADN35281.1 translation initiation factor, aIF-2BII family [Methanolacinia petrolearia DSM 11571]